MTNEWARCTACNSLDVDEFADGTARCENCGDQVTRQSDLPTHARDHSEDEGLVIYPVLVLAWAVCQTCGSTEGETGDPEDDHCRDCGAALVPLKRRARAEGFPFPEDEATAEPGPEVTPDATSHQFAIGDRGVCTGVKGIRLGGGGPFTELRVTNIRPNGDLDVAGTADGTVWMGIPADAVLHLP
jgi:hypothetical protein